ncbi:MAG: antibiotic biosynthesis monooxygenase [Nitrososphaeraceae archaeon]|jgi:quinol monooxygenase YgiN
MRNNQIHFKIEFIIEEGKTDEYKKLIQDMSRMVEVNEPDTVVYEFYLNDDETKCIVHEGYSDSEAALAHATSTASKSVLPKIFNISKISRFEVYGDPSEKLQKELAGFNAQPYKLFAGFRR